MSVEITSPNGDVLLSVVGADGTPYKRYQNGPPSWTSALPATQDYYLHAVSVGPATAYTLRVWIEPLNDNGSAERIEFAPGATTASRSGALPEGGVKAYILTASAGQTMQYATPADIYNSPAATFVAGFTGSPPMNLLPCKLADMRIHVGSVSFPLSGSMPQAPTGSELVFGIRPENIRLQASDGAVATSATVVVTEPLGAETLVTFDIGSHEMVARCSANFAQRPGTVMPVYLDAARMHLFDRQTGLALR